jgi:hypothetical protein
MYCDIFASHDHVRPRCPKFWAVRLVKVQCGFAVEGLGFFISIMSSHSINVMKLAQL